MGAHGFTWVRTWGTPGTSKISHRQPDGSGLAYWQKRGLAVVLRSIALSSSNCHRVLPSHLLAAKSCMCDSSQEMSPHPGRGMQDLESVRVQGSHDACLSPCAVHEPTVPLPHGPAWPLGPLRRPAPLCV